MSGSLRTNNIASTCVIAIVRVTGPAAMYRLAVGQHSLFGAKADYREFRRIVSCLGFAFVVVCHALRVPPS